MPWFPGIGELVATHGLVFIGSLCGMAIAEPQGSAAVAGLLSEDLHIFQPQLLALDPFTSIFHKVSHKSREEILKRSGSDVSLPNMSELRTAALGAQSYSIKCKVFIWFFLFVCFN